jgi:hypothetical protein
MAYEVLPFIVLGIQINGLITQRPACLHFQRSMLSKPYTPMRTLNKEQGILKEKYFVQAQFSIY